MKYVYSNKNIKVYLLKILIKAKRKPVVYRLYGESGSGKTTFLRNFAADRNDVLWISCEELKDLFCLRLNESEKITVLPDIKIDNSEMNNILMRFNSLIGVESYIQRLKA